MKPRIPGGFLHRVLDPPPSPPARVTGPDIAGRAFRGADVRDLTVVAHASSSSQAAERLRLALIEHAGRLQHDSWHLTSSVRLVDPPAALATGPATFLTWTTRAGGIDRTWAGAYLRQGRVTWEVLAAAPPPVAPLPVVADTATGLIRHNLRFPEASLWDLLPLAEDLPVPMWLEAVLGDDPLELAAAVA